MDTYVLWENDDFTVSTPTNPHQSYEQGLHIIVSPKMSIANAWSDLNLSAEAFKLAAEVCSICERLNLSPWYNLQSNGNWGLLPGGKTSFHIHILGRNKTENWGKPVKLPELPGTYHFDPMPESDRTLLAKEFESSIFV